MKQQTDLLPEVALMQSKATGADGTHSLRLVIFCHVHYLDIWAEIAARIEETIRQPFHMTVTTPESLGEIEPPNSPHLRGFRVLRVENRGRDIRPFLQALREEPDFDIGLKLHTKRSIHRLDGNEWRHAIIGSLLPQAGKTERIIDLLSTSTEVGVVAPEGALCTVESWMGPNRKGVEKVSRRLGFKVSDLLAACPYFIAGSMFWFRRDALQPFLAASLDDLFEAEAGQTDGTTAHAIERMVAAVAAREGWAGISTGAIRIAEPSLSLNALHEATLAEVDADTRFLRRPNPSIAWLSYRLPWTIALYRNLPKPTRRLIRSGLFRIAGLVRPSNGSRT